MAVAARSKGRVYDDPCGVARALNVVGERWALLVVRELLFGPKRFADLQHGLPTMSANVLSQRLRDLESDGVITKRRAGAPVGGNVYELTPRGHELEAVLRSLATWGSRLPVPSGNELSVDALVLALHTTVDPAKPGLHGSFTLRFGAEEIGIEADGHTITATRVPLAAPTATITTDVATLRSVVFGGRTTADAIRAGALSLGGDTASARRFLGMFARPKPA